MQTYTHLAIGGAVASVVVPGNYLAQAVIVTGSVVPDLALAAARFKYVADVAMKRKSKANFSDLSLAVRDILHSIPLWSAALAVLMVFGFSTISFFSAAVLGHCFIDALTHCGPQFRATDQGLLWPWSFKLGSLVGIWEYRYDHGVLRPKPFEALVVVVSLATWVGSLWL